MSEDEAQTLACADVSRETGDRLRHFVELLRDEAARQNLVSAASMDQVWQRHILDSAQLVPLANVTGTWLDIGSGAGLPGVVVAVLRDAPMVLVEPRAKRAAFLESVVAALGIDDRTHVVAKMAGSVPRMEAAVISARAVAPLDALLGMGQRFATPDTVWVLPKGRSAAAELAATGASWQGDFRLVPSRTDSSAAIIVARGVRPK